eukprot:195543-Chlamydomonas_euryale.AAC.3
MLFIGLVCASFPSSHIWRCVGTGCPSSGAIAALGQGAPVVVHSWHSGRVPHARCAGRAWRGAVHALHAPQACIPQHASPLVLVPRVLHCSHRVYCTVRSACTAVLAPRVLHCSYRMF